ncbi:universal stress protein [bacterium]|jgi:nucleotide-binding universal stress UspA family protein|nr:universal stress protein [Balneola sp.]MBR9917778.1 universal stress protein [bacterium]
MKVNRILIPTDFSEQSKSALKLAGFFTKIYGSTIDLIHIVPFSLYMSESMDKMGLPFDMDKDLYPKVVEKAKSELDELASDFIMEKYLGKTHVQVDRKPSSAIAEFANKEGYDLILMSAKGAHETNFFKGSITDKVIRKAHAPVFTVSRKYTSSGFERIVTAIDLSEHSLASLALSVELTYQFDTTLKLLYVNQLYSSEGYGFVAPTVGISNEDSNLLFQKRLDDYFNANKELGLSLQKTKQEFEYRIIKNDGASSISVPVHLEVVPGISVPYEITEYANKHADLLIMTTHGRTGIKRVLMGSTAAQVVQQVDVSMLTIRPDNFKLG